MEKEEKVILTGELAKDAEPFLDERRELGCRLTVRKSKLHSVLNRPLASREKYKVEVFSPLRDTLFRTARAHTRVLVPGILNEKRGVVRAEVVYRA